MAHNERENLDGFIEDAEQSPDPDDRYTLQQIASSRAAITGDPDQHFSSANHFVGRFWVVEPRNGNPELVSYRRRFVDAEVADDLFIDLHHLLTFERCWSGLGGDDQHLTPHQRRSVEGKSSSDWPRGHVVYAPWDRMWIVTIAENLATDEATLLAIRQRFVIDEASYRVVPKMQLNAHLQTPGSE